MEKDIIEKSWEMHIASKSKGRKMFVDYWVPIDGLNFMQVNIIHEHTF